MGVAEALFNTLLIFNTILLNLLFKNDFATVASASGRPLVNRSGRLFTDLRRRLHPQGDGLHGGRTASHPVERHAALVQGKRSGGQQAAAQAVAASVDGRPPDRHDHRRDRSCRQRFDQKLAAGRVARVQRRWRCFIAFRRLSARYRWRGDGGVGGGGGGGLVRASPIICDRRCAANTTVDRCCYGGCLL